MVWSWKSSLATWALHGSTLPLLPLLLLLPLCPLFQSFGCSLQNQCQGQGLKFGLKFGAPPFGEGPWKLPLVYPTGHCGLTCVFQKNLLNLQSLSPGLTVAGYESATPRT